MIKVLWLASWYPNAMNPLTGDFIKRQAEAVSSIIPVSVVFAGKYPDGIIPTNILHSGSDDRKYEKLEEHILYYTAKSSLKVFNKWKAAMAYFKIHLKFIQGLQKKNELPDLVHVHVAMKAGLIALYIKWKYKIPYILTEHWTGYYSDANDSLKKKSLLYRYFTRRIINNAIRFLPVSEDLGHYINKNWTPVSFQKIPNVVNTDLFYPSIKNIQSTFRFIHVSSLIDQKNPKGIVRSFIELRKQNFDAELVMAGPVSVDLLDYISRNNSEKRIQCTGTISYEQVSMEIRKASALILFSFYENMPCVILEALCAGIPVISTRVGGVPEVISNHNGILIEAGNEIELLEAMKKMMLNFSRFDRDQISRLATNQFSYQTIGQQITNVYRSALTGK